VTTKLSAVLVAALTIATIAAAPSAIASTTRSATTGVGACGGAPSDYVGTFHGDLRNPTNPKSVQYYLTLTFRQQLQEHGNPIYTYTFKTADKGGNRTDPPPGTNYKDSIIVDRTNRTLRHILVSFELADQTFSYAGVSTSRRLPLTALGCTAGQTAPTRLQYIFPTLVEGLPTNHLILNRP
jgi:hypothetical protein